MEKNFILNGWDAWRKIACIAFILNCGILTAMAQKQITGMTVDVGGDPLVGVSIIIKGTSSGTLTDFNGKFTITVSEGQQLEFTYLGYVPQTVPVNAQTGNLHIVMQESSIALNEVVVTALGISRSQKALSYNVQELKGSELTGVKDVNFMNSLSGKVAGVTINSSSAGIGGASRVVMRGTKSITKDNNALYVIDGVPLFNISGGDLNEKHEYANQPRGEGISDLNPEDIASISVLTGPAAAALYGSNAANGAIVITTKKGVAGKPHLIISNQTTFSKPFVMPQFQNRYGNKPGEYMSWGDRQNKYAFNPADFFNMGATEQTTASLSVGSEKNQTYMSLGITNATGIIPDNAYNKYNVSLRNTTKFLEDRMTLDFGFSYIRQNDRNMIAQGRYYNPLTAVYTYPRGEDFDYARNYEIYSEANGYDVQQWKWGNQGIDMQNPYWILYRNPNTNKRDRYMMNVNLQYDVFDWLNLQGRARLDNSSQDQERKNFASTDALFADVNGQYDFNRQGDKQIYADILANVNKSWGDYSLTANIGASISDARSDTYGVKGSLMIPNYFATTNINLSAPKTALNQTGWHDQTQSVFANLEGGWKSMIYLTLTGRNDWSSALANTKNKSFFYPSVGLSGIISQMVSLPEAISYLKVRGSFSSVGSPIPHNLSIATYSFDSQGGSWSTNTYKPIDDLKPEKTDSWEAGLTARFWENKLILNATWYKSNTKNQTLKIPISTSSGYSSMYVQTGNVLNTGTELSLGTENRLGNLRWAAMLTAGYNLNKIVQLVEPDKFFDPAGNPIVLDVIGQGGIGSSEYRLTEGGTMGDLWVKNKLKKNEDGTIFLSSDGRPVLENELEKVGSVLPRWNLGFKNDFTWKDVTLGVLISARLGGVVISPTQAILDGYGVTEATAQARDNGGIPNGTGKIDAHNYYSVTGQAGGLLSDYVYSADNVRLQEMSLGYNLPSKWFDNKMKMSLSVVGRNLWMIYNKAPFDPEMTASTGTYFQGIDYFMQPSLRNIGFNVRLEF